MSPFCHQLSVSLPCPMKTLVSRVFRDLQVWVSPDLLPAYINALCYKGDVFGGGVVSVNSVFLLLAGTCNQEFWLNLR